MQVSSLLRGSMCNQLQPHCKQKFLSSFHEQYCKKVDNFLKNKIALFELCIRTCLHCGFKHVLTHVCSDDRHLASLLNNLHCYFGHYKQVVRSRAPKGQETWLFFLGGGEKGVGKDHILSPSTTPIYVLQILIDHRCGRAAIFATSQ